MRVVVDEIDDFIPSFVTMKFFAKAIVIPPNFPMKERAVVLASFKPLKVKRTSASWNGRFKETIGFERSERVK